MHAAVGRDGVADGREGDRVQARGDFPDGGLGEWERAAVKEAESSRERWGSNPTFRRGNFGGTSGRERSGDDRT
jgi:hypothetical protein